MSYEEEHDAYMLHCEWDFHLANLYSNRVYADYAHLKLSLDPIETLAQGEPLGRLTELKTISTVNNLEGTKDLIANTIDFTSTRFDIKKHFDENPPIISIAEDSCVLYKARFWFWCKRNEPFSIWLKRYTHQLNVKIINDSSQDLSVFLQSSKETIQLMAKKGDITYDSAESAVIYSGSMAPEDEFESLIPEDDKFLFNIDNGTYSRLA